MRDRRMTREQQEELDHKWAYRPQPRRKSTIVQENQDNAAVERAIDAAIKVIQDHVGETDGGFAADYFSGCCALWHHPQGELDIDSFRFILSEYLKCQRDATVWVTEGMRVRLTDDIEFFPHFVARKNMHGTVTYVDASTFEVKMDRPIPGCEEWDNTLYFGCDELTWEAYPHVKTFRDYGLMMMTEADDRRRGERRKS